MASPQVSNPNPSPEGGATAGGSGDSQPTPDAVTGRTQLLQTLHEAVALGNKYQAADIAMQLAQLKLNLQVKEDPSAKLPTPVEKTEAEISLKVYIEDKNMTAGSVMWKVKPSATISSLKYRMLREHGFPMEVQRWIIGRRIAKDEDTLSSCNVRVDGTSVFVYLVSASSVSLSKSAFLQKHGNDIPKNLPVYENVNIGAGNSNEGDYISIIPGDDPLLPTQNNAGAALQAMPPPLPPRNLQQPGGLSPHAGPRTAGPHHYQNVPNQAGAETSNNNLLDEFEVVPNVQVQLNRDPGSAPNLLAEDPDLPYSIEVSDLEQVGWQCPRCTFCNEPTRPGCEACTGPRPESYVIPENYQVSERERERLRKEQELEKLAQEANNELELERGPQIDLTPDQLDRLLRLNDQFQELRGRLRHGENVSAEDMERIRSLTSEFRHQRSNVPQVTHAEPVEHPAPLSVVGGRAQPVEQVEDEDDQNQLFV